MDVDGDGWIIFGAGVRAISRLNWLAFFWANFSVSFSFLCRVLDFVGCKSFAALVIKIVN